MNCLKLSILLACLIGVKALPTSNLAQPKFESNLANYLVNFNTLDYAVDPSVTEECFSLYLPMLSEVANTFSTQYQACNTVANEKIVNLTDQADGSKSTFIQQSSDICTAYQNCANESDILTLFNCFSSVSNMEVSVVYQISSSATTAANTFSEGLKTIQNEQAQCTNTTENTYVENTAATYALLDSCLKNGLPKTDSTTTVSTVTTVVVPTAPIETTTDLFDNENGDQNVLASSGTQSLSECSGVSCTHRN